MATELGVGAVLEATTKLFESHHLRLTNSSYMYNCPARLEHINDAMKTVKCERYRKPSCLI